MYNFEQDLHGLFLTVAIKSSLKKNTQKPSRDVDPDPNPDPHFNADPDPKEIKNENPKKSIILYNYLSLFCCLRLKQTRKLFKIN